MERNDGAIARVKSSLSGSADRKHEDALIERLVSQLSPERADPGTSAIIRRIAELEVGQATLEKWTRDWPTIGSLAIDGVQNTKIANLEEKLAAPSRSAVEVAAMQKRIDQLHKDLQHHGDMKIHAGSVADLGSLRSKVETLEKQVAALQATVAAQDHHKKDG